MFLAPASCPSYNFFYFPRGDVILTSFACKCEEDVKIVQEQKSVKENKFKSTESGSQTVSQNSFSKLWKQSAHPLSAPLIKKNKKNPECWLGWTGASLVASTSGLWVQLAAPDLNNLPKNAPITAPNPGCLARLLLAWLHGAAKPRGWLAKALQD